MSKAVPLAYDSEHRVQLKWVKTSGLADYDDPTLYKCVPMRSCKNFNLKCVECSPCPGV